MEPKKPYHHGGLKDALIAAGIHILETRGLDGLSLRAIAAHVGVSHTAPKNHFGSLRGLLTAIATHGFALHRQFMQPAAVDADQSARQTAAMQGYVRFARTHPHLFKLMFSPTMCDFDDPDLSAAATGSYGVLQGIAQGLDWDKSGAPDANRRAEMLLWSIVHGFAMLELSGMTSPFLGALDIDQIMPRFGYAPKP